MGINIHPICQIKSPVDLIDGHRVFEINGGGVGPPGTVLARRAIFPGRTAASRANAGAAGLSELAHRR